MSTLTNSLMGGAVCRPNLQRLVMARPTTEEIEMTKQDADFDAACVSRLYELSYDYGADGSIARQLLNIVRELIGV